MSLMDTFSNVNSLGYSTATRSAERIGPASDTPTIGGQAARFVSNVSAAALSGNSQTVTAQFTGVNHINNLPGPSSANEAGQKASANVVASQNAQSDLKQAQDTMKDFQACVKDMQQPLQAALVQGAKNLGYDAKAANASFGPDAPSTMAGVITSAAAAKSGIPLVAKVAAATDITTNVNDAIKVAGKLNPAQEAKLADQVRTLISPKVNDAGEVVAKAAVPNNLNADFLQGMSSAELVQTCKQCMLPAENQPEWQIMQGVEADLKEQVAIHEKEKGLNEVALAGAESAGISKAEVTISDTYSAYGVETAGALPTGYPVNADASVVDGSLALVSLDAVTREGLINQGQNMEPNREFTHVSTHQFSTGVTA